MLTSVFQWLSWASPRNRAGRDGRQQLTRPRAERRRSYVPHVDLLEDRTVMSVLTVLNNADSGVGSLRAAIAAAQSGDTIVFDPSLAYQTITLSSGPLALSSNLTINGPGANLLTISGNNASRVFSISGAMTQVAIDRLTISNGLATGVTLTDAASGDTLTAGGGILNDGANPTLSQVALTDNQALATESNSWGGGGAIANVDGARLTVTDATFSGNSAQSEFIAGGGAIRNDVNSTALIANCTFTGNQTTAPVVSAGGAIAEYAGSQLTVSASTFANNLAQDARSAGSTAVSGAIDVERFGFFQGSPATATIASSSFVNNAAIGSGVGASAFGGAVGNQCTLTIADSLFTGNRAVAGPMADGVNTLGQGIGGAIVTQGPGSILTLSNSIVAGNQALGGSAASTLMYGGTGGAYGGGISGAFGETLNVAGCTITGNQALGGASASGAGGVANGGGIDNEQGTLNLKDSTVSANLCQSGAGPSGAAGGLTSGGGIRNAIGSVAILTNSTISLNACLGGPGGAGANGGTAEGGGIRNGGAITDTSSLIVSNCQVVGNMVQGGTEGSAAVGGDGLGGGLFAGSGTVVLQAVLVSGNQAQGGGDGNGNTTGQGLGGGLYVDPSASATADMATFIAGNQATKDKKDVWGTLTIVP